MRTSALPKFHKLYRKINENDGKLSSGTYKFRIHYSYPVDSFKGGKQIVLSTTSWMGGKNPFLGIAYITTGCICISIAIFFIAYPKVTNKKRQLGDISFLRWTGEDATGDRQ